MFNKTLLSIVFVLSVLSCASADTSGETVNNEQEPLVNSQADVGIVNGRFFDQPKQYTTIGETEYVVQYSFWRNTMPRTATDGRHPTHGSVTLIPTGDELPALALTLEDVTIETNFGPTVPSRTQLFHLNDSQGYRIDMHDIPVGQGDYLVRVSISLSVEASDASHSVIIKDPALGVTH